MMMRLSLLVIGLLSTAPGFAQAGDDTAGETFPQKLTAQQLLYYCASSALSSSGRNRQNYCSGFVSGVEESVRLLDTDGHTGSKKFICIPEGKPASHFREIYIKYASKKIADLGQPAVLVALQALESTYPCAGKR